MQGLNDLEQAVLDKLLAGEHQILATLRHQAEHARLAERKNTGVGFFCYFDVDREVPVVERNCDIGDVHAEVEGMAYGAGFVLFIRDGRLSVLEGFSYGEPWPSEIRGFSLGYHDSERRSELAKLG